MTASEKIQVRINYTRPDKVKQYDKQLEFIDAPVRFTYVEATSKAGKTTGCLVWLFEQAISPYGWFYPDPTGLGLVTNGEGLTDKAGYNYWWVAPTYAVAKIAFRRIKRFIGNKELFIANESELTITLANGAMIFFKGADKPDSLYGEDVFAVVVDEASRTKSEAWTAILSTITATDGLAKMIGNVKGINNWFYERCRQAEKKELENAAYFRITARDAVAAKILKARVIREAASQLSEADFLELFYGIPNTQAADQYAYAFNNAKHVKNCDVDYRYPIYLSFDFNVNPISCTVIQRYNGTIYIPHVLQLANSNIYKLCELIRVKFPGAYFIVTGDATGKNTSAMVRDNLNYFRIIKAELKLTLQQMKQLPSNPPTDQNQVLVNAVLEHIPHCVDPTNAKPLIDDFTLAKVDERGKLLKKDRTQQAQRLEALDGYRYFVNRFCQNQIKNLRNQ